MAAAVACVPVRCAVVGGACVGVRGVARRGLMTWGRAAPKRPPTVLPAEVTPMRDVPAGIARPSYAESSVPPDEDKRPPRLSTRDRERMRHAGQVARDVLRETGAAVRPGITTDELDAIAHRAIIARGAYPSPLNYLGFPKSICTSVNEVAVHGIPDLRPLRAEDVINIDVTVFVDGVHGDTSAMFFVDPAHTPADVKALCAVTQQARDAAIALCRPGVPLAAIAATVGAIADEHGFGIMNEFTGHGIGRKFHTTPAIFHAPTPLIDQHAVMKAHTAFTIEPILTVGTPKYVMWEDGWTVTTADNSPAAVCEHTLLISDKGAEILTL